MPLFTDNPLATVPYPPSLREIWGSARKVARFRGGLQDGQTMALDHDYGRNIRFPVYRSPFSYAADPVAPLEIQTQVEEYVVTGSTIHGIPEWNRTAATAAMNYTIEIEYSVAAATQATISAMNAWSNLNQVIATTGASWAQWNQEWNQIPLTPEQEAARARRLLRDKRIQIRASKRARKTLTRFLDQEQLVSYAATGRFRVVASNGWVFELRKQGNPLLLGDDGHADASFCIHPREAFPKEDTLLSFMLMLMTDVDDFLRIANRTTIRKRQLTLEPPPLAVPLAVPQVAVAA